MPKGIPKDGRKPGNPNINEYNKKTRITHETAVEYGRKGRSSQRAMKTFMEIFKEELANVDENDKTAKQAVVESLIKRCKMGDVQAAQLVIRMIGEMPSDKVSIAVEHIDTSALDALEGLVLDDKRTGH